MPIMKNIFGQETPYAIQQRRTEEEHKMKIAQMQELLRNSQSQRRLDAINRLMKQAQLEQYNKTGDTSYLGTSSQKRFGTVPWYLSPDWINTPEGEAAREKALKGMSDIDQIKMWRGIQSSAEGQYFYPGGLEGGAKEPKNKELYDLATENINKIMQRMKGRNIQEYFGPGTTENIIPSGVEGQETTGQENGELFTPVPGEPTQQQTPSGDIRDYFGTVPGAQVPGAQATAPKTFGQIGITDIDDMVALDEMQKALPDIDMRQEYEANPENMKELMELWRQGKLNKSNLHKAFSKIQQSARQALGIA